MPTDLSNENTLSQVPGPFRIYVLVADVDSTDDDLWIIVDACKDQYRGFAQNPDDVSPLYPPTFCCAHARLLNPHPLSHPGTSAAPVYMGRKPEG